MPLGQLQQAVALGRGDIRAGRVVAHRLDKEQPGPFDTQHGLQRIHVRAISQARNAQQPRAVQLQLAVGARLAGDGLCSSPKGPAQSMLLQQLAQYRA